MKTRYIVLIIAFSACTNRDITKKDIDKFISKYNNENFDNLNGISVFERSRSINEIVYGVGKYQANKPLYFVDFNTFGQSISKVNKSLLERDSIPDYLTENQISNAVTTIRKYNFFLLTIDSLGNVFINPFYANEPAYFLRLKQQTSNSIVKNGFVYKLYKDNWYINEEFK